MPGGASMQEVELEAKKTAPTGDQTTIQAQNDFWESDEELELGLAAEDKISPAATEKWYSRCCSCCSYCNACSISNIAGAVWNSGMTCMAIASAIQAATALFVKLTNGRIPVFELVTVRSGLCMTFTICMIKWRKISPTFGHREHYPALVVRGLAGAISMSFYYFAIMRLPLSDTTTIFFTHPAMVLALAWLVKGELIGLMGILGMLCSLVGVVFVARPPFLTGGADWTTDHIIGVLCCLMAALLAAVAFVAIRFIPKSEASFSVALWFHTMGVVSAAIPLAMGIPQWPVLPGVFDACCILGIATGSFSSHAFIARSFQVEKAGKASAAGYLQVAFAYLYSITILHESTSLYGILGSLIICLGVIATSWPAKKADLLPQTDTNTPEKQTDQDDESAPLFVSPQDLNRSKHSNSSNGLEASKTSAKPEVEMEKKQRIEDRIVESPAAIPSSISMNMIAGQKN